MTARRFDPERVLLGTVRIGLALILLTPLVTAPWTLYPFSVGKALWARVLIAAVFTLWAALALMRPRWRPPRSALLAVLGAGLASAALSAGFGVSPDQSFWSTYERMQGVVNAAHWAAFALVVASVTRGEQEWTRLLNVNLGVGLAVSVLAILRYSTPDLPLPMPRSEGYWPRIGASAGNPILLGAYLQAIALLAIGFLVRSNCAPGLTARAPGTVRSQKRAASRHGGRRSGKAAACPEPGDEMGLRLFWAATASCSLAGLSLTGSLGAFTGLAAGLGSACALYALFGRVRRSRRLGLTGLGALAACALALAIILALRGPAGEAPAFDNPMLERATSAERIGFTAGNRFRIWESGMKAFTERPLLGWGPENYFVASARHISPPDRRARVQYHAHNLAVEEAAGKGAVGLAAWLALWGLTGLVALRAAWRLEDARQRALAVFAAAVLAGWFVQAQTAFYSAESWLQHMLLLGFLVHIEAALRVDAPARGQLAVWLRRWWASVPRPVRMPVGARVAAGAVAFVLAGASLASSVAIHRGAAAMWRADHGGPFIAELERAIGAFEPMATGPRVVLFNNLALNWEVLQRTDAEEAARLLALADRHAETALASQPESWVLHHALARLYLKVANTKREYVARANRHLERSRVLAPNLDPMEAPLPPARARSAAP
ncbi:MAG: O-antigen ligase family protein [Paracoccaceae bacterium]|nr:O-antigen ligase family protein [Paracoccaceae bacterium]